MPTPSLTDVMSTFPVRVDARTTVTDALQLLARYGFHHLPVSHGAEVIGVVSAPVLTAAKVAGGATLPLSELCVEPPLSVDIRTPVREVAHQMLLGGTDAAVVTSRERLAGIITTSDICAVLVELLPGPPPLKSPPPDVA